MTTGLRKWRAFVSRALVVAVSSFAVFAARAALVEDFAGLQSAIGSMASGDTIKLKAGATIVFTAKLTPANNKGFTLSGGWTDESTRAAGARTTLSGADTVDLFGLSNGTGCPVTFENLVFTHAQQQAVGKTAGAGALTFLDCDFWSNGLGQYNPFGRGIGVTSGGLVAVSNCTFRGNAIEVDASYTPNPGGAIYVKGITRLTVDDSLFVTNGIAPSVTYGYQHTGHDGYKGSAIYTESPLTCRNSVFRYNRAVHRWANGGGTVYLAASAGNSALTNCLFCGNQDSAGYTTAQTSACSGSLLVNCSSASAAVSVDKCTFAYNIGNSGLGAGGITVVKGALTLRNSVLYGNARNGESSSTGGADLTVTASASADIDYTLFTSLALDRVNIGGASTMGTHILTGDPSFVTPLSDFQACIGEGTGYGQYCFKYAAGPAILAFDAHLKSKVGYRLNDGTRVTDGTVDSIAIDAGDPAADYSREPSPDNGKCVNLGAYANTPNASESRPVAPKIGEVTVTFPNNETRPEFTVAMGSETPGVYVATVYILYGTGDVATDGYAVTNVIGSVTNGKTVTSGGTRYFEPGDDLYVKVIAKTGSATDEKTIAEPFEVTGSKPGYIGHGGDPTKVVHVRAGAMGAATGDDWESAYPTLGAAYAAVTATRNEIWVMGDFALSTAAIPFTVPASVVIRGGFTGAEDDESARTPGRVTVLDGQAVVNIFDIANANGTVRLERFTFRHALNRAVSKTGAGAITVADCRFESNGTNYTTMASSGRALYLKGAASTVATVTNCVFTGNGQQQPKFSEPENGPTLYAETFARLYLDDCRFEGNGPSFAANANSGDNNPYSNGANGTAVYVTGAPLTARRTTFVGNRANGRCTNWQSGGTGYLNGRGGVIKFVGNSGGSVLSNCLFAANENLEGYQNQPTQTGYDQGTIVLAMDTSARTVDLVNCTVAYNTDNSTYGAAGLTAKVGTANVKNSIFYGNLVGGYTQTGVDFVTYDTGFVNIEYSILGTDERSTWSTLAGNIVEGTGVIHADPSFVTDWDTIKACVISSGNYRFDAAKQEELIRETDLHLQSKKGYYLNDGTKVTDGTVDSKALDAGDPTDSYANEPIPNGSRVNCGYYGNTAKASNSDPATPVVGDITVTFPDNISRPDISFTMSGTTPDDYTATVVISYGTGTVSVTEYQFSKTYPGVHNGDHILFKSPEYLFAGDAFAVKVTVLVAGQEPVVKDAEPTEVTGELPVWWDKKGPAYVIHVREGALGRGDGTSWKDAFTDMASAITAFCDDTSGVKSEIWISGTMRYSKSCLAYVFDRPLAFRGGFTGAEETAAARSAGTVATLDGIDLYNLILFQNADAVAFERLVFTGAGENALYKTGGAGDVSVRDCRFVRNGVMTSGIWGKGCRFVGTGAAKASVSNCLFSGNLVKNAGSTSGRGCGISAEGLARLTVDDSLFVTNGLDVTWNYGFPTPGCEGTAGAAVYAENTPVTVRNSQFRGNRGTTRWNGDGHPFNEGRHGGIVQLYGACGGSAFTNCLFTGNANTSGCGGQNGMSSGALVIDLANASDTVDIDRTTIAYNIAASAVSGAGLTVVKGTVSVANSILYDNCRHRNSPAGADLYVYAGAANVRYTLLTSNDTASVSAGAGATLTLGAGLITDLPARLVTTEAEFAARVTDDSKSGNWYFTRNDATRDAIATFNVHLRGQGYADEFTREPMPRYPWNERSPAIDAGDPASQVWRGEPRPNGHRLNMGAYGGTPWATRFRPGAAIFIR